MVSLLISKMGKLITRQKPQAAYEALRRKGYLSEAGVAGPDAVVLALQRVLDSWPIEPMPGSEPWRDMQAVLEEKGFLSAAGLKASRKFVSR